MERNPIYQRIQRSSGTLWRLTVRLLIAIAGLYIAINVLWAAGVVTGIISSDLYPSGVLGWALLLLVPVPLAIFTVVQTSRDSRLDDYALVSITKLTAREIVQGYEGARKRFGMLVTVLVTLAVMSAVLPILFLALAHIAPVRVVPAIYLPYMILYINQMNRIGPAAGIWAALRFRDPAMVRCCWYSTGFSAGLQSMCCWWRYSSFCRTVSSSNGRSARCDDHHEPYLPAHAAHDRQPVA
jgi:hypothetical protein